MFQHRLIGLMAFSCASGARLFQHKSKLFNIICNRGFKNFGHKRQPQSRFTTLWHGFLTFSFIGMGIEWKRIARFLYGENSEHEIPPTE